MPKTITLSGSIAKKEILVPIEVHILENTHVSEATSPYAKYYGDLPQKPKPNSLFFHTKNFYFLEELLSFSQGLEKCLLDNINIASAHINYKNKQYPAIRIKNFPDYSHLSAFQQCIVSQNVDLAPGLKINGEVEARIHKLFVLKEIDTNIYLDTIEDHKGYFIPEKKIMPEYFDEVARNVKNNAECKLFDAVQGEILKDGQVIEIIRIFAEGLDLPLLQCLKSNFNKLG